MPVSRSQETLFKKEKKTVKPMLAYVDENGNLTSTTPDPHKKVVERDAIVISVSRQPNVPDQPQERIVSLYTSLKQRTLNT